ncbi:MAG: flap endonuclease [Myxococcales bacterium]|nr:flap endonuclease [Myxococcales bacterium]
MATRLYLVDGTFELFRAHYGAARDGRTPGPFDAVAGIVRSVTQLLSRHGATHVAVAFDHVIESFRNDLFAGYKSGEGIDPVLRAQFEPAEAAMTALGVVMWPMVEFEADDAIATAAARFGGEAEIVIASPDKDLMQCVRGTHVTTWDRIRDRHFDDAAVREKFGVGPASIPDFLALVGDTSDGIPGLPKWGEKSAAAVLARWVHLDAIPDDHADWDCTVRGAPGLAATLREQRENALLYRTLATLRTDVPLAETHLDALRWTSADLAALEGVAEACNDPGLLARVPAPRF